MPIKMQDMQYTDAQTRQAEHTTAFNRTYVVPTQVTYTYDPEHMRYLGQDTEGRTYVIQCDDIQYRLNRVNDIPFSFTYQNEPETDCSEVLDLLTEP